MDRLQVQTSDRSSVKVRAVEDARQTQAGVTAAANKAGKTPPKYVLDELIGKGSFGRVYRGKDLTTAEMVAVKIIDIDKSDTISPRNADSFNEFLKEINALKKLSKNRARNINHVIEALSVGQSMWLITEYCGGGSVATLMRPTTPGGLQEKWIIPILREVAEALRWVHQADIIHRDIKSANVLVTEQGFVQLCDFGVAGTMETKLDKRSTFIGTLHWMAPELFDPSPSYSKEVDIWAFGCMAFEMATGLPPNVSNAVPYERLGAHLKNHPPRLEGGSYSDGLRSLIDYCLEELPSSRPAIELVQRHHYIFESGLQHPTSALSHLVQAFRFWEDHGGNRRSLFMHSTTQGHSDVSPPFFSDEEWNFSTSSTFDQSIIRGSSAQDVYEAYGADVELDAVLAQDAFDPNAPQHGRGSRRRPPPKALARLRAPLERIFDPNTLSNYEDNSRDHYSQQILPARSDLPLRDDSAHTSIRDTMIDLGDDDTDQGDSNAIDLDTMKPEKTSVGDYTRADAPTLAGTIYSDPTDNLSKRHTKDWKFPTIVPPLSADLTQTFFTTTESDFDGQPTLIHRATEPIGTTGFEAGPTHRSRASDRTSVRVSLIDLDMSLPDTLLQSAESSTASSDAESMTGDEMNPCHHPFELERHATLYQPDLEEDGMGSYDGEEAKKIDEPECLSSEHSTTPPGLQRSVTQSPRTAYTMAHFPNIAQPPSMAALSGTISYSEMADELKRLIGGMAGQLQSFRDVYSSPIVTSKLGSRRRRETDEGDA